MGTHKGGNKKPLTSARRCLFIVSLFICLSLQTEELLQRQFDSLLNLLSDTDVSVRILAVKGVCRALQVGEGRGGEGRTGERRGAIQRPGVASGGMDR